MKQEVVWGEFRVVAKPLPAHSAGFEGWSHSADGALIKHLFDDCQREEEDEKKTDI